MKDNRNQKIGVGAGRKIKGVKVANGTAPKQAGSKRFIEGMEHGIEVQAKAHATEMDKVQGGIDAVREELHQAAESSRATEAIIDDLNNREGAALYGIAFSRTFAELKESRNESVLLCTLLRYLLQDAADKRAVNESQRHFYLELRRFLGVDDKTAEASARAFDFSYLRNIDSNEDKKLIALAAYTLLFLGDCSFGFKAAYPMLIDELHLRKEEDENISRYIKSTFNLFGAEGMTAVLDVGKETDDEESDDEADDAEDEEEIPVDYERIYQTVMDAVNTGKLGRPLLKAKENPVRVAAKKTANNIGKGMYFISDIYMKKTVGEGLELRDERILRNLEIVRILKGSNLELLGSKVIEITKLKEGLLVFSFSSIYYVKGENYAEIWLPYLTLERIRSDSSRVIVDMGQYEVEICDKKADAGVLSNLLKDLCAIGNFDVDNELEYLTAMSDENRLNYIGLTATLCEEMELELSSGELYVLAATLGVSAQLDECPTFHLENYKKYCQSILHKQLLFFAIISAVQLAQYEKKSDELTEREKAILQSALEGTLIEATDENLEAIISFAQLERHIRLGEQTSETEICRISRTFHNVVNSVSYYLDYYMNHVPLLSLSYYTEKMEGNLYGKAISITNPLMIGAFVKSAKDNKSIMAMLPGELQQARDEMYEAAKAAYEAEESEENGEPKE